MSQFKVGDLVTLIKDEIMPHGLTSDYGKVGRLVRKTMATTCVRKIYCEHWVIDGFKYVYPDKAIRKIEPPDTYDGNQAGSWDLIPWTPARTKTEV